MPLLVPVHEACVSEVQTLLPRQQVPKQSASHVSGRQTPGLETPPSWPQRIGAMKRQDSAQPGPQQR